MNGWLDGFEIVLRKVEVVFIRVNESIFDMDEGRLSDGDVVLGICADYEKVGDKAILLTLRKEDVLDLVNEGGIESLLQELDGVLDLHQSLYNS